MGEKYANVPTFPFSVKNPRFQDFASGVLSVAFLVFLSAAARARIVAADLVAVNRGIGACRSL